MRILTGPIAAIAIYVLLAGYPHELRAAAGVAALMAVWWIVEAVAVSMTAILPVILFPILGVTTMQEACFPFSHPVIFLFMGGFIMATAMEHWHLHQRVALYLIRLVGEEPRYIVAAFMGACAFFSMWISNTATVVMLLPIAMSVIGAARAQIEIAESVHLNFSRCLLLGIAYSASIGGVGTLIGSPPNALFAAFMGQETGNAVGFGEWMLMGLPLTIVFLPIAWLLLTRVMFPIHIRTVPNIREHMDEALQKLGPMGWPQYVIVGIFVIVASLWVFRPLLPWPLNDSSIAMFGAFLMFLLPSGRDRKSRLLTWEIAEHLPWGVLLLFGGGLSLAAGLSKSGVTELIGSTVAGWGSFQPTLLVMAVVALIITFTSLMSNTATVAMFLPILASIAVGQGSDPMLLALPATFAASFAFIMPVATPPNAIVFASGKITIAEMAKAGSVLTVLGIVVISIYTQWFLS